MKTKKYYTVGTVSKSSKTKIVERGNIDTLNTQIHDRSISCLGTGTSIKQCGGVKLVIWAQTSMKKKVNML